MLIINNYIDKEDLKDIDNNIETKNRFNEIQTISSPSKRYWMSVFV